MDVVIRDATEQDAEALAVLLTQLGYPQDSAFVIRKLREFADRPSARVFVAETAGEHAISTLEQASVVGFLGFDSEPAFHREGRIGTITALCVLDEVRGGAIGRILVAHAERFAKENGCVRIAVSSGVHRTRTHQFYIGLGYEEKTKRFVKDF